MSAIPLVAVGDQLDRHSHSLETQGVGAAEAVEAVVEIAVVAGVG